MEREKVRGIERVIVRRESIVNVDGSQVDEDERAWEKVNGAKVITSAKTRASVLADFARPRNLIRR